MSKIKAGTVLLAEPFMWDAHFKRSAVLIVEHRRDGDVGFIMNKPIKMEIDELVGYFPPFEAEVYYGGPVATDTVHFIHNVGDLIEDSVEVAQGVYWGGDFEKLKFLVTMEMVKPENVKFFVGYSGWSEGQLLEEIESGGWILDEMHHNYAFKGNNVNMWKEILRNKGASFAIIADMPDQPMYN